jgi:hypothetical protein
MRQGKLVFAQLMLCLSVFAWAPFCSTKAAIKQHMMWATQHMTQS